MPVHVYMHPGSWHCPARLKMTPCLEQQAHYTLTSIVVFGMVRVYAPLCVLPDLKMAAQSMNVVGVSCIMPVFISVGEEREKNQSSCYFWTVRNLVSSCSNSVLKSLCDLLHFLLSLLMDSMEYVFFFHFDRTRKRGQDWNRLEWPRVLNDLGMSPVRCCEWGCWRCPVAPAAVAAAPCCWRRLWSAAAPTGQWRPSAAARESEAAPSRPGISSAPPAAARPCLWPFSPERYEWGRGGGKFNPEFFLMANCCSQNLWTYLFLLFSLLISLVWTISCFSKLLVDKEFSRSLRSSRVVWWIT